MAQNRALKLEAPTEMVSPISFGFDTLTQDTGDKYHLFHRNTDKYGTAYTIDIRITPEDIEHRETISGLNDRKERCNAGFEVVWTHNAELKKVREVWDTDPDRLFNFDYNLQQRHMNDLIRNPVVAQLIKEHEAPFKKAALGQ